MGKYSNVKRENQLKNLVFDDYFKQKNVSWEQDIDNIDFILTDIQSRNEKEHGGAKKHYAWLEVKKGEADELDMITQLILTIKKTLKKAEVVPPPYIGCFDTSTITFVPFHNIHDIFNDNDVNWNTTPSNHEKEDFVKLKNKIKKLIDEEKECFTFIINLQRDLMKKVIYCLKK